MAQGHTLIRYDGRGIGLSGRWQGELDASTRLQDLEAVVDAAALETFSVFGQSEGTVSALTYAAAHPGRVEKLVVFGGYAKYGSEWGTSPEGRAEQEALLTLMSRGWGQDEPRFRQIFTSMFIPSASDEQTRWFNYLERESADPATAIATLKSIYASDARDEAESITVPALVLHLRDDQAVSPFPGAAAWPRSCLEPS